MEQKMKDNRAFQEMRIVAVARLQEALPENIAKNSNVEYDSRKRCFTLESLGKTVQVSYPEYEITPELESWHHLILLHYLDGADGTMLSEEYINFGSLKDGLIRGTRFDHTMEQELAFFLKDKSPEQVKNCFLKLGGRVIKSRADLAIVLEFLPMYPVLVNIWFADEEFPASGKMFINKSADHYLSVEDAVTVGEVLLTELKAMEL